MNYLIKTLTSIIMVYLSINYSFAQATASATATATIVTPISITKNIDMNFGNISVTSSGGTVILDPNGTRTKTGGITLPIITGTVTAAQFTVSGQGNYTYDITLPSSSVVLSSGANSMNATSFTCSIGTTAGSLSAGSPGTQTFNVGATLAINANQPSGSYTTATPFNVTVNYN
ncbi:MAG: DUF4402 domain-containing protein [Chitinophagaceae bacterium]|nr:DUF4402 domain-containing protein [Chitinophagaceae bacterium]